MPADAGYPAQILPAFLMTGLGMGLSFVPLQIAAQAGVPAERAGLVAGLINTSQEVGGALGVAAAATFAFRRVASLTAAAHGKPAPDPGSPDHRVPRRVRRGRDLRGHRAAGLRHSPAAHPQGRRPGRRLTGGPDQRFTAVRTKP